MSKNATRKSVGRPSAFRPEYAEQAAKLCRLGAIDLDLADFFDVSEVTINAWKKAHPEFLKSLKDAKAEADRSVAESLLDRAQGASFTVQKEVKLKKEWWENGKKFVEERVEVVDLQMEVPPDTTACIFWLKNRRPDLWRDKQEHQHSGADGGPVAIQIYMPENNR